MQGRTLLVFIYIRTSRRLRVEADRSSQVSGTYDPISGGFATLSPFAETHPIQTCRSSQTCLSKWNRISEDRMTRRQSLVGEFKVACCGVRSPITPTRLPPLPVTPTVSKSCTAHWVDGGCPIWEFWFH